MKRVLLAVVLSLAAPLGGAAEGLGGEPIPNRYLVLLEDGADAAVVSAGLAESHGLAVVHVYRRAVTGFSALIPPLRLAALRQDERVRAVAADRALVVLGKGPERGSLSPEGAFALLDTGIDPDRLEGILAGGVTLVTTEEEPTSDGRDDNGHGTVIAEAFAALSPSGRFWSVKVLNRDGEGAFSDLIAGIDWLLDTAAHPAIRSAHFGLGAICDQCRADSEDAAVAALRSAVRKAAVSGIALSSEAPEDEADAERTVPAVFEDVTALASTSGAGGTGLSAALSGAFVLGEVYSFPNPARSGEKPTIHVEAGIADRVVIRIYDVAGRLVKEGEVVGTPSVVDDGQGPEYAYEFIWGGSIPSGVYFFTVRAEKSGESPLTATGKLAVVR